MIEWRSEGDILRSGADIIVIPVNCVGVMGAGLAKQVLQKWPYILKDHKRFCRMNSLLPGMVRMTSAEGGPFFALAATKDDWRDPSKLDWIESCLIEIRNEAAHFQYVAGSVTVAIPALGCGLGGLDWKDVKPLIEGTFALLPGILAVVYEPRVLTRVEKSLVPVADRR